jgi:HAMP domain-containing protein
MTVVSGGTVFIATCLGGCNRRLSRAHSKIADLQRLAAETTAEHETTAPSRAQQQRRPRRDSAAAGSPNRASGGHVPCCRQQRLGGDNGVSRR